MYKVTSMEVVNAFGLLLSFVLVLQVDFANRNSRSAFYKQLEEQGGDVGPGGDGSRMGMGGGDMFFGDMMPPGPMGPHGSHPPPGPPGRRGGFRPDFHGGYMGGRGGGDGGGRGRGGRGGPMFRSGPSGRGLFTRHFRGNMMHEDDDYDRELRNFGYMRERERQRQRVWEQGEEEETSDAVNSPADGSDVLSPHSPHSDMSDGEDAHGRSVGGPGDKWPELKTTSYTKKERSTIVKLEGDARNRISEKQSAESKKSKPTQEISREKCESSSPHAENSLEGRERHSPSPSRRPAQSHGEASNSSQHSSNNSSSKRGEKSDGSRHYQAHRDKDGYPEGGKSSKRTAEGERRRRRDEDDQSAHSKPVSSSTAGTSSRQRTRSRSRSPLAPSRRSRRSPPLPSDDGRSPGGSKVGHDDNWSNRRDYSPQHRSSSNSNNWRSRHTNTDPESAGRPPGHGVSSAQRSPQYSPSQSTPVNGSQLVAGETIITPSSAAIAAAAASAPPTMYAVKMPAASGYVVPQPATTFVYDANNQPIAVQSAPTEGQAKAGFVTADVYVQAAPAQNQVVALGLPQPASTPTATPAAAPPAAAIQNVPAASIMPAANQPVQQADALLGLLQRYPVMWQGHLALKNDAAAVQMHFLSGSQQLAQLALPQPSVSSPAAATLRIAQRMRLDPSQLEGVGLRMQVRLPLLHIICTFVWPICLFCSFFLHCCQFVGLIDVDFYCSM